MSTDYPDGGAVAPSPERRPGRASDGGPPVTGVLTIVLAVIAVVAGFLILRAISGDNGGGSAISPGATSSTMPTSTTDAPAVTAESTTTTTTEPPLTFEGATVVVANASGVNGAAGQMSRALEGAGFTMGEATNRAPQTPQLDTTVIYYDSSVDAARRVAESVNRLMGADSSISPLPEAIPTADGSLQGEVLVMLGNDKAGKSLEELAPVPTDSVVPSPGVTGEDGAEDSGDDPASESTTG